MNDPIVRLTRAQVREVDRRAIEHYHIPGIVLMENAAIHAAHLAFEMLNNLPKSAAIICGDGNNGGDGLAIARHLHNRGININLILAQGDFKGDAAINHQIIRAMSLKTHSIQVAKSILNPYTTNLIIDALFGTGLTRPITGDLATLIQQMNDSNLPTLAIDLPSGLDCDTGNPLSPACIKATRTVTFVAEKSGFANPASKQYTGEITIADIGCPKQVIAEILRDFPA
jgi:NAD(P)H-hydrate epimerase